MTQHFADLRDHGIDPSLHHLIGRVGHDGQHLRESEGADQRRQQAEAARKVRIAESEPLVGVDALLSDHGGEQAEEPGDPAFEGIAQGGEVAGDDDSEHRQPEELE